MGDWGREAGDTRHSRVPGAELRELPLPPPREKPALSIQEVTGSASGGGRLEGEGQRTDARGQAPHLLECHPSPCQRSGVGGSPPTDALRKGCAAGLLPIGQPSLASSPFLAGFPGAWYIVSWCPGGQTSDGGKRVCVLFCGVGGISEPRTYLANEVVITPSSLIG